MAGTEVFPSKGVDCVLRYESAQAERLMSAVHKVTDGVAPGVQGLL